MLQGPKSLVHIRVQTSCNRSGTHLGLDVLISLPKPVPLEYSIEQLTCAVASRLDAGMVG